MKKSSLYLGTFWGIPVKIHWTFLFLLFYIPFAGKKIGLGTTGILMFGLITAIVFLCVVLHEYGHALTARKYGIQTNDILLTPIGGIARLQDMPRKPWQEIIVAIAGPLVNLAIIVILAISIFFTKLSFFPEVDEIEMITNPKYLPPMVLWFNAMLLGFNLIPAFPMDGGRVLRALLNMKLDRQKATLIAARFGQLLTLGFIGIGIWLSQYSLIFIGIFIFFAAQQEYLSAKRDHKIHSSKAEDIMRKEFSFVEKYDSMRDVFEKYGQSNQKDFLIKGERDNELAGVLHEEFIESALSNKDYYSPAVGYITQHFEQVLATDTVMDVLSLFQKKNYSIVPVYDHYNRLVGVIDRSILQNFLSGR